MSINSFRRPGSGAPARQGLQKAGELIRNAFRPPANVTNPLNPMPPRFPWGLYNIGLFVTTFWQGVQGGDLTKSDLDSVERFLGYKPTAFVAVELGTPNTFQGGQSSTTIYRAEIEFFSNWVGSWVVAGTAGNFYGPVEGWVWKPIEGDPTRSHLYLKARSSTGQPYDVAFQYGTGVVTLNGQMNLSHSTSSPNPRNLRIIIVSSNVQDTVGGGGGTPPVFSPTRAPDAFIPPKPVSPTNPAPAPVITPNTNNPQKEKKAASPPAPLTSPTPTPYPDINPTPTNPDLNPQPTSAPAPAPGTSPVKTTSYIPGATPPPAIPPLPPGTMRTTNFLPPSSKDSITTKEPYTTPQKNEAKPLPFIPPIPGREPVEPVPAKLECKDLNSCLTPPSTPVGQANSKLDQLLALLQGGDLFQGQLILNKVTENNALLKHADFGLEKIMNFLGTMHNFAKKAWEATRMDKILNALNTVLVLHNAAMLSRNLAGSLGDLLSAGLNNIISLVKNEEFDAININETIGNTVENMLKGILGVEAYNGVSETFNKYSRILNAAANILHTTMSAMAGLAEGLELLGQYTGKIGNALKKSGAVLESSYQWMSEVFTVKTGRLGSIQRAIDLGEQIEQVTSDLVEVTENFREVQESINTVETEIDRVKTEIAGKETEKAQTETTGKTGSQPPTIELTDLVRPSEGE